MVFSYAHFLGGNRVDAYEKVLMFIREQGKKVNSDTPKMAGMASNFTVKTRTLILDEEDLLVDSHLKGKLEKVDPVLI